MSEVKKRRRKPCPSCGGDRWVDDQNWSPQHPDVKWERTPRDGRIPCGRCNFAGWNVPDGKGQLC